jgi:hypothetical protein
MAISADAKAMNIAIARGIRTLLVFMESPCAGQTGEV